MTVFILNGILGFVLSVTLGTRRIGLRDYEWWVCVACLMGAFLVGKLR